MATSQPAPIQRDFIVEVNGHWQVDPIWAQWLQDLRNLVDGLTGAASTGTGLVVRQTAPTLITPSIGAATGASLALLNGITTGQTVLHHTSVNLANGAAANVGTLNNAPALGDPTKWISIDDNGTTRYVPSW